MIRKSQLTEENKKLKRKLFIWGNINISINSSIKEKEIAAEKFLNEHHDYNLYEVSDTIKIKKKASTMCDRVLGLIILLKEK